MGKKMFKRCNTVLSIVSFSPFVAPNENIC